jgi:hypothetical protein
MIFANQYWCQVKNYLLKMKCSRLFLWILIEVMIVLYFINQMLRNVLIN